MVSFLTQGGHPRQIEEIRDFDEISMKFRRDFDFSTLDENFDQSKSPFLILMHSFSLEARALMLITFGSTTLSPRELVPRPVLNAPEWALTAGRA